MVGRSDCKDRQGHGGRRDGWTSRSRRGVEQVSTKFTTLSGFENPKMRADNVLIDVRVLPKGEVHVNTDQLVCIFLSQLK